MLGHNSNALMPWSFKKNDLWNFQRFLTSVIYDTFRCWILEVQWINFFYFIFNFFWIYLSLFLDNDALILDFSQVFCSCNLVKHWVYFSEVLKNVVQILHIQVYRISFNMPVHFNGRWKSPQNVDNSIFQVVVLIFHLKSASMGYRPIDSMMPYL